MTVDEVAAALEGVRVGGVLLTPQERAMLARYVAARVRCDCQRGTIKERLNAIKPTTRG